MRKFLTSVILAWALVLAPFMRANWMPILSASYSSAVSYAFTENFETPTTGYDNTGWGTGSSPNPTYATAPAPLQGTQSLRTTGGAQINRSVSGSTLNIFFYINITTWADFENIVEILNGSFGTVFRVGTWTPNVLRITHGGTQAVGTFAISANTTYYVWADYTKGTGSDGVAHLYVSSTTTKPGTADATITTGTATTDVASIYYGQNSTAVYIFDHIIQNPTSIGSNP